MKQMRIAWIALLFLFGCAPLTQRDLRLEYLNQTRAIGMTPVYPPRGEVQVGDVYLTFVPADGGENEATSLFVGSMTSMRDQALTYLASRDNIGGLMPDGNTAAPLAEMRILPAVNFPSITGSAASSASLGAVAPVFSGLFSVGSADTVTMKFVDVRAFGMPYLAASVSAPDFQRNVCPRLLGRVNALYGELGYVGAARMTGPPPCGDPKAAAKGQSCRVQIITRTYLTRQIDFTYNQKRRIGGSVATVTPLAPATPVATPPSIAVSVDGSTPPDTAASIITALKAPAPATAATTAATAVSETAQGLKFDQLFDDPLAIAYEAVSLSLIDADQLCPLTK
jgi:hypothetical protein